MQAKQCLFGLAAQELRKYGGGGVNPDVRIYSGCRRGVCWRLFVISLVTVHPRRDHGTCVLRACANLRSEGAHVSDQSCSSCSFFLNPFSYLSHQFITMCNLQQGFAGIMLP